MQEYETFTVSVLFQFEARAFFFEVSVEDMKAYLAFKIIAIMTRETFVS